MKEDVICKQLEQLSNEVGAVFVEDRNTKTLRFDSMGSASLSSFVPSIKQLAKQQGFKKLTVKAPDSQAIYFFQHGFKIEASILAYYGLQDAIYLAYYFDPAPNALSAPQAEILDKALSPQTNTHSQNNTNEQPIVVVAQASSDQSSVLSTPVETFSGQIKCVSNDQVDTFNGFIGEQAIARVNTLFHQHDKAVELLDFTVDLKTDPCVVLKSLLPFIELHYKEHGCETIFTIVSANSLAVNKGFADADFEFGGTLKNESTFQGQLSHLNTWFKRL
ncbi:hypothetical protein LP316_01230 [Thalassotalea sp. LPB0316]|uniref:hypothetical protein n=1 Tax=Thalassotalea sp. LPB0316 TaxID=2769490 RepID=UPI0018671C19|nr:hypothetical protein [Thalassotalea sp. LPB0316]QOL25967.1 hypothetical protein LP316_01230 [Thalassotalea sp. LPB0316]